MYYNETWPHEGNRIIDLKRVADLGAEPVTLTEAKTQLRVTFTDDDTEITGFITKARKRVENYCNISIVYQRIQLIAWYHCQEELPYGPVIGIESVQDSAGPTGSGPVSYATTTGDWRVDGDLFTHVTGYNTKVIYTAGMGTCPADLKDTILQVITFLYENRGKNIDVEGLNNVLKNAENYQRLLWI